MTLNDRNALTLFCVEVNENRSL